MAVGWGGSPGRGDVCVSFFSVPDSQESEKRRRDCRSYFFLSQFPAGHTRMKLVWCLFWYGKGEAEASR